MEKAWADYEHLLKFDRCQCDLHETQVDLYAERIEFLGDRAFWECTKEEKEAYWQHIKKKFGEWCIRLGPDEYYSASYCISCLQKLLQLLEEKLESLA